MSSEGADQSFLVELLRALQATGLEAIVVGSTAAILQGVPILTEDVDLLVRDTPSNRAKLDRLAEELGRARPVPISPMTSAVRLVDPESVQVDVLFEEISGGLTFASLRSRSVAVVIGELTAVVAELGDVIRSKRAANRPKDQAQLPMLEAFVRVKQAVDEDPG